MFQSYAWNRAAAEIFARREAPFVVYAASGSGAALIPAAIALERREITLLGEEMFDYRDILAQGDPGVQQAAWEPLAALKMPLSVKAICDHRLGQFWVDFPSEFFCNAPRIAAADITSEQLEAAHRRLGRFWRRALRSGAELREYDGSASALVRQIYQDKASQFGPCPGNLFCDPLRVEFMVSVAQAVGRACQIFTLEKAGHVMSALVAFRDRNVRHFYTVSYDQGFADYSPGTVLLFEICRRTLADGLDCDLMTGEQPYKMRLATSTVPLYRVHASAGEVAAAARTRVELAA